MIIDCISDLHGEFPVLAGGDLLLLGGDYTASDKLVQWAEFFKWLKEQPYRKKVLISGNHDNVLEQMYPKTAAEAEKLAEVREFLEMMGEEKEDFDYLCDSGTEFEGLKIWGTPWSAQFKGIHPKCCAFTARYFDHTDQLLEEYWKKIPDDTDILLSHSPPFGILDGVRKRGTPRKEKILNPAGSMSLREHVMVRIKPALHVFGHIHEWGGKQLDCVTTRFVNASIVNEEYNAVNKPVRIIL